MPLPAEPGYIDPAACRPCHAAIYRSYERTGMGRSFSKHVELRPATFYHRASNRQYQLIQRDGAWHLRRHQIDGGGATVNVIERRVDAVMGSGNHAKSYLHRTAQGRWIELPLSWYAENGGKWAMSPGYDSRSHFDFRREITDACMFCHNGYPSDSNGGTGAGIDCQRCHGPGQSHARSAAKADIVNPARLAPDRQIEVCLQCHLETESRNIPDSLMRPDRTVYSYRPGQPLGDYKLFFDHAPGKGSGDKFEINHAAYRLFQSKCFNESAGRMTCTTCHNPHGDPLTREACGQCHTSGHAREQSGCAGCHMPKRRTQDAVHAVMTDHKIVIRPPPGDLLAPLAENHQPYRGEVVAYRWPADPLSLAIAQVRDENNLDAGIALLRKLLPGSREALADAYRRRGDREQALSEYKRLEPKSARARIGMGDTLLRLGRIREAIVALEPLRGSGDPHALNPLGVALGAGGRLRESVAALSESVKLNPDLPVSWVNLGVALEHTGDRDGAAAAYLEALRLQPDLAEAKHHLDTLRGK